MPLIPFSGGTSLEGHFVAPFAGISLDLSRMDSILAVHPDDGDIVVQSGARWEDINAHLSEQGHQLFFPLDPGPGATIGGMIATGCSGTNAVRYGTARAEWFLNVTVVLPNGEVIKTRQRARKSSAGFDLTKIFVGAEGTLGVVTEGQSAGPTPARVHLFYKADSFPTFTFSRTATLRLTPKLPTSVAICHFPSVAHASKAVQEVLLKGAPVRECRDIEFPNSFNRPYAHASLLVPPSPPTQNASNSSTTK